MSGFPGRRRWCRNGIASDADVALSGSGLCYAREYDPYSSSAALPLEYRSHQRIDMSNSRLKVRSWGPATCPQRVRCIVHGLPIIHSDLWHEQKAASFFLFAGPFDVRKFMAALCQFLQVASPARSFLFV